MTSIFNLQLEQDKTSRYRQVVCLDRRKQFHLYEIIKNIYIYI